MANDKKTSRSFDLDKGGKRSFDLEKKSTRAFDLTKDNPGVAASPVVVPKSGKPDSQPAKSANSQKPADVPPTPTGPSDNGESNDGGSKKKWLWIILAVIVLAILAYLLIPGGRSKTTPSEGDSTEVVTGDSTSMEPADSVSADSATANTNPAENESTGESSDGASNTQAASAGKSSSNTPSAATRQTENVGDSPVNEPSNTIAPAGSIEEQAQQVIKGVYGNNPERRHKLGADYKAIQKRVNELMRSR